VAVRAGFLDDSSLICRGIGTPQTLMTCASPDYLSNFGEPQSPSELIKHECLIMSGSYDPGRWQYIVNGAKTPIKVNSTLMVNNYSVLIELCQHHLGIIKAPLFMVSPLIASGKLKQVLSTFSLPPIQFHALYPQSGRNSVKVQLFLDALDNNLII